ncbi:STAS domain-containing protein [Microbacterium sp.]|uniref:STAS domain-containing protein n=1 Tax=Microbacterium sp. TaxID=51671 RepID=UPI003A86BBA0
MELNITETQNALYVSVSGRFDVHTTGQFAREVIARVADGHPQLFIDLADVDFMDSSALAALVRSLMRTMEVGGSLTVTRLSDAARIALELSRLDLVLTGPIPAVTPPPAMNAIAFAA